MQITPEWRKTLTPYVKSTELAGRPPARAPLDVDVVFAAIIDPADRIAASQVRYNYAKPTRWSIWVVTSTVLAHVDIEYDEECYDCTAQEARRRDSTRKPVASELKEAWARPLAAISKLQFGGFSPRLDDFNPYDVVEYCLLDLQVTFLDGEDRQTLPVGATRPPRDEEERKKWEGFVSAIRAGAPSPLTVEFVPSG
jgi:hypothetical protein